MRGVLQLIQQFSFFIDEMRKVNFITSVTPSLLRSFTFMTGADERANTIMCLDNTDRGYRCRMTINTGGDVNCEFQQNK